jgi:hypothetical protein
MIGSSALLVPIRNDCVLLLPDGNLMEDNHALMVRQIWEFFNCFGGVLGLSKQNTDPDFYGLA